MECKDTDFETNRRSAKNQSTGRAGGGGKNDETKSKGRNQPRITGKVVNSARKELRRRSKLAKLKSRNIPEQRLKEAAEMLRNPDHQIWKVQKSCNASIHRYYQKNNSSSHITDHLRCLRQCLLRKDWPNLCRLLSIIPADPRYDFYYPIFLKVCCLGGSTRPSQSITNCLELCGSIRDCTFPYPTVVCDHLLGSHELGTFE